MKRIYTIFTLMLSVGCLCGGLVGCTKKFDQLNVNPNQPISNSTDPALNNALISGLLESAETRGLMASFEFQRVQGLYADLYAQYFANVAPYFASDQYDVNQNWLDAGWELFYPRDIKNLITIVQSPFASKNQKLIARAWKVFLFHRYVDFYGDIPYSTAGTDKPEVYDVQKDIYYDFFKELAAVSDSLDVSVPQSFKSGDEIYGGSTLAWKKFTNSLRLRLALRISKADPAKAKLEAEAAINNGVFTANSDNAYCKVNANGQQDNALNAISGFSEFRMSASMQSIMVGYNDPRLPVYFSPYSGIKDPNDNVNKFTYDGVQNGQTNAQRAANFKDAKISNVGAAFSVPKKATNPRVVMTYAEVCFLLAEAKLNGWSAPGSVSSYYNLGIAASMASANYLQTANGLGNTIADTAITRYTSSLAPPINPLGLVGENRAISSLPVKLSTAELDQREQIAIQKWLAVFPDGFEGWANVRRTGFPKLYLPANTVPATDVPKGQFIQRLPYVFVQRSYPVSAAAIAKAEARMGVSGGRGQNVALWFAGGK